MLGSKLTWFLYGIEIGYGTEIDLVFVSGVEIDFVFVPGAKMTWFYLVHGYEFDLVLVRRSQLTLFLCAGRK